jgi:hypothetical protein
VERLLAIVHAAGRLVSPAVDWLWQVAFLIIARWLQLLDPLFRWLLNHRRPPQEQQVPEAQGERQNPDFDYGKIGPGADLTPYLKAALLIIVLLVLIGWLYRLNRRRQELAEDEEERISLGFWRSLWADLRALWGLVARKAAPAASALAAKLGGGDSQDPRSLFRRLQAWGAARGRPRREAETPNRYRDGLARVIPEAAAPAESVTVVYNQARYGRTAPAAADVAAARQALERLEKGSE